MCVCVFPAARSSGNIEIYAGKQSQGGGLVNIAGALSKFGDGGSVHVTSGATLEELTSRSGKLLLSTASSARSGAARLATGTASSGTSGQVTVATGAGTAAGDILVGPRRALSEGRGHSHTLLSPVKGEKLMYLCQWCDMRNSLAGVLASVLEHEKDTVQTFYA